MKKNQREYARPVTAFVVFRTQEACERTKKHFQSQHYFYTDKEQLEILGEKLTCLAAAEPSNIIWENLQYTAHQ